MTPGHGEKLSRFQERAIAALMTYGTVERAAKRIGVTKKTLLRWMGREPFKAAYKAARGRVLEDITTFLTSAGKPAVRTLKHNLKSSVGTPATQNAAAVALLDRVFKATELLELEARIAALEAARDDNP